MAWYEGTLTNAAGALKAILDAYLPLNPYWHIEDPNAGTNVGVYHNDDTDRGVDYIVVVRDNQTDYASLELWEGWNSGGHVGVGASLVSATGYTLRKASGGWGLSVLDHRFLYFKKDPVGQRQAFYVGQPRRFDETKNIPIMICTSSTVINTPVGTNPQDTGIEWRCLFDQDRVARTLYPYMHYNGGALQCGIKSKNNRVWIVETCVFDSSNKWAQGVLEGVMHARYLLNMVDGDVVLDEAGIEWEVNINSIYQGALIRKN